MEVADVPEEVQPRIHEMLAALKLVESKQLWKVTAEVEKEVFEGSDGAGDWRPAKEGENFEHSKAAVCGVKFILEAFGARIVASYADPQNADADDWRHLLYPPQPAGKYSIDFCNSNGTVAIFSDGKAISFEVSKYGAGGDGSIEVTIPIDECREAIEHVWGEYIRVYGGECG